jgi:hypothetical protein
MRLKIAAILLLLGLVPAAASSARIDFVRYSERPGPDNVVAITGSTGDIEVVDTILPVTVPTPAIASSLQLQARVRAVIGAVWVYRGAAPGGWTAADLRANGYRIDGGDELLLPVTPGEIISLVGETAAASAGAGQRVIGTRANDGSNAAAGSSHLTVGGSDGANLRPVAVDTAGRLRTVTTIPTASATGNGAVSTPAAGGTACTALPSQAVDLVEFAAPASAAQVEYQIGGSGAYFPIFPGYVVQVPGVSNANAICVRRTDQATTVQAIPYRWFTR